MKEVIVIDNIALVQLPEGAFNIEFNDIREPELFFEMGTCKVCVELPLGYKYKTVGFWKELSEEQAMTFFDNSSLELNGLQLLATDFFRFQLKSKIEAAGWFLDNPYGEKMPKVIWDKRRKGAQSNPETRQWQSAELKTLHNPYILKIEKI